MAAAAAAQTPDLGFAVPPGMTDAIEVPRWWTDAADLTVWGSWCWQRMSGANPHGAHREDLRCPQHGGHLHTKATMHGHRDSGFLTCETFIKMALQH